MRIPHKRPQRTPYKRPRPTITWHNLRVTRHGQAVPDEVALRALSLFFWQEPLPPGTKVHIPIPGCNIDFTGMPAEPKGQLNLVQQAQRRGQRLLGLPVP